MIKQITFLSFLLMIVLAPLNGQTIEKLDKKGYHASFADENNILITNNNYKGLELYNLVSKEEVVLSTELKSGKDVYTENKQIHFTLKQGVVASDFEGNINSLTVPKKSFSAKETALSELNTSKLAEETTILFVKSVNKLTALEIYFSNGSTKIISPLMEGARYLKSEVSPDGKNILIKQYGGNGYVINADGKILVDLGYMERPKWSDTNHIVYQVTKDDGEIITDSDVYEINTGNKEVRNLTIEFNGIAMEPSPSPNGDKLIFNTPEGELYIIKK
ncbi:MAG: hypothetical protein ABFR62_08750 [Bacteroidota bacterium]